MKRILIFCLFMAVVSNKIKAESTFDNWPELRAFHNVMSATFPSAEDGNLKPIKEKSRELATKDAKIQNSLMPKVYDSPAIKASIKKLFIESKALDQLSKKKAKDAVILKSLTGLHDRFHEIIGLCKEENH